MKKIDNSLQNIEFSKKNKGLMPRHDLFVRIILEEIENSKSFLKEYLPAELSEKMNFDSLEIKKDSFITSEYREYFSDMLYQIKLNNKPVEIYILFEHKSKPEKFIFAQLLKYIAGIWELQKSKIITPIIPFVFYHGKQKWNYSSNLHDQIIGLDDDLKKYVPCFNIYSVI